MAAGCAALFALVVVGAYAWGPGQTLDEEGLAGFVQSRHGWLRPVAWRFTDFGNPPRWPRSRSRWRPSRSCAGGRAWRWACSPWSPRPACRASCSRSCSRIRASRRSSTTRSAPGAPQRPRDRRDVARARRRAGRAAPGALGRRRDRLGARARRRGLRGRRGLALPERRDRRLPAGHRLGADDLRGAPRGQPPLPRERALGEHHARPRERPDRHRRPRAAGRRRRRRRGAGHRRPAAHRHERRELLRPRAHGLRGRGRGVASSALALPVTLAGVARRG